jgi:hypothetical protein
MAVRMSPAENGMVFRGGASAPSPVGTLIGWGGGIALDKNLNVYVSSSTNASNFPTTAGAAQPECGSSACGGPSLPQNVYITKISPVGGALKTVEATARSAHRTHRRMARPMGDVSVDA